MRLIKWTMGAGLFALVAVFLISIVFPSDVVIRNESSETISSVQIHYTYGTNTVQEHTTSESLGAIEAGKAVTKNLYTGDATLSVSFSRGQETRTLSCGYVTSNFSHFVIMIGQNLEETSCKHKPRT